MKGRKPAMIKAVSGKGSLSRAPVAPAWMSEAARAEWRRVVPTLVDRNILTATDLGCVEAYCVAIGRIRELEALIQADPLDKTLYRLQTQATQTARQLAAEIGATPVSRSRPAVSDEIEPEEDALGL